MVVCNLETLSPIHIGSGRFLVKNNEFICVDGEIAVIDDSKVLDIIGEENIGQWLSVIDKGESIWNLIKTRKPNISLKEIAKRNYIHYADKTEGNNLKEQLIDGSGNPYIPGSSIKGAIRSAVFDYLIHENLNRINTHDISKVIKGKERLSSRMLENRLFGNDPNSDFFRFLLVGDAIFEKDSLVGLGVNSLNIKRNKVIDDDSKYVLTEVIDCNKATKFRLKINNDLLNKNIELAGIHKNKASTLSSVEHLFKIINSHTLALLDQEKVFWSNHSEHTAADEYLTSIKEMYDEIEKCKTNECVLRVGYGSGWLFMTGGWAYDQNLVSDELFELIVHHSRPRNDRYKEYEFPKSRRMSINYELFGFVKLNFQQ